MAVEKKYASTARLSIDCCFFDNATCCLPFRLRLRCSLLSSNTSPPGASHHFFYLFASLTNRTHGQVAIGGPPGPEICFLVTTILIVLITFFGHYQLSQATSSVTSSPCYTIISDNSPSISKTTHFRLSQDRVLIPARDFTSIKSNLPLFLYCLTIKI